MGQRLSANQALYQAAMSQGNYGLANKLASRMQVESNTISAANARLNGAASYVYQPGYSAYPY